MDRFVVCILLSLLMMEFNESFIQVSGSNIFDVVEYGAIGDGKVDDAQAFLKAWEATCGAKGGTPLLQIPPGRTFKLSSISFKGPCRSPYVHVSLLGRIIAFEKPSWSIRNSHWLQFSSVDGLYINGGGHGEIDGQGDTWWNCKQSISGSVTCKGCEYDTIKGCGRPTALHFNSCNNLKLRGLTSVKSPKNHISLSKCQGALISDLHLVAPANSPNTDGFDISRSTNIDIRNSFIGTGDDCIAINGGSTFINITSVACGPGHGISVGSLGDFGEHSEVEAVRVTNCNFTGTTNGVRIKTSEGGSGYARNIIFEKITLEDVKNPIIIDQSYNPIDKNRGNVQVSDVTYIGVHGSSMKPIAIILKCSKSTPCKNIQMQDVNIESANPRTKTTSICENVNGKASSTNPIVPCLRT